MAVKQGCYQYARKKYKRGNSIRKSTWRSRPTFTVVNNKGNKATHTDLAWVITRGYDSSLDLHRIADNDTFASNVVRGRSKGKDIGIWGYDLVDTDKKWNHIVNKAIDAVYRYIL